MAPFEDWGARLGFRACGLVRSLGHPTIWPEGEPNVGGASLTPLGAAGKRGGWQAAKLARV